MVEVSKTIIERWNVEALPTSSSILLNPYKVQTHRENTDPSPYNSDYKGGSRATYFVSAIGSRSFRTLNLGLSGVHGDYFRRWVEVGADRPCCRRSERQRATHEMI